MTKEYRTVTLDVEVTKKIDQEARDMHLEFSTRLNQLLHEFFDNKEVKKK